MHVLAIDIGSYSIKYVSSFVEKRSITHVEMSEIILQDYLADHPDATELQAQARIIKEIIESVARPETKVIYQIPQHLVTTRFLNLPVKSRKKAEMMVPFQLEEDIPYSLSEIQYAYKLETQKTQSHAIVELSRLNEFEPFYQVLKDENILPHLLTTETSAMDTFFMDNSMMGSYAVIDIGHKTTKAFFFYNGRLISAHTSFFGGQLINEVIAENYKIDLDEAVFYKHQNAYYLTSSQYEDVDEAQKDFAKMMDKVSSPLINDFSRWKIGFKMSFGLTLEHVFICGGTSNIKNMTNYLGEKWDVKVSLLESFERVHTEKIDLHAKNKCKFVLANMLAQGWRRKNKLLNFLTGKFAQASLSDVPVHSLAFIATRVATVTAILAISLVAERFLIQRDIKAVNAKLTTLMKNDDLQITGRVRRQLMTDPKPVYDIVVKRQRGIRQEISTLQSAIEIQALAPLVRVSQIAAQTAATLIEFKVTDLKEITAIFSADKIEDLENLKKSFERSGLESLQSTVDPQNLKLTVTATGN